MAARYTAHMPRIEEPGDFPTGTWRDVGFFTWEVAKLVAIPFAAVTGVLGFTATALYFLAERPIFALIPALGLVAAIFGLAWYGKYRQDAVARAAAEEDTRPKPRRPGL